MDIPNHAHGGLRSDSRLLSIPREVRDLIYEHYTIVEGGYIYESDDLLGGRLKRADGRPIDLNLMYACRLVANEMRHLALRSNTLTFSTITSESGPSPLAMLEGLRMRAARFDGLVGRCLDRYRQQLLHFAGGFLARRRFEEQQARTTTSEEGNHDHEENDSDGSSSDLAAASKVHVDPPSTEDPDGVSSSGSSPSGEPSWATAQLTLDELAKKHPRFLRVLERMDHEDLTPWRAWGFTHFRRGPYGEAPSSYLELCCDLLQAASRLKPNDWNQLEWCRLMNISENRLAGGETRSSRIMRCSVREWDIPKAADLKELSSWITEEKRLLSSIRHGSDGSVYRFSAAASAIRYLKSIPAAMRAQVRKIVLVEDYRSVAHPESHARGLIPFCRENPLLRVERRVNLWRNLFQVDKRWHTPHQQCERQNRAATRALRSRDITSTVALWVTEALALGPAGMPAASFSLVLDGDPAPQLCARIFQTVVQRDAAWQRAWTESMDRRLVLVHPVLDWFERRGEDAARAGVHPVSGMYESYLGYFYEGFPEAMRDIARGSSGSVVRCNFDAGEPWDAEKVVRANKMWTSAQWNEGWLRHEQLFWETEAPLPEWPALLMENMIDSFSGCKKKSWRGR
ncbi:hypothetical protein CTAM01_08112 [Colletotrichum tamarilloi]|uniref:Uncharacterized protein n=1 Tax=Colletotrichum tamarilloi TaxID=1209934 RepID=A0ABQ9R793_9PEZI|nr:uncharacterized protein CTAM01_08112 [Colletotrichum tamarilloi]KAK1497100.1 hypothetical protein CTAM01_08112 [Colletotrichum tamarilloi]